MPEATGKNISVDQEGLGTVLKRHHLEVPPNQRDYAWTNDEVTQLFRDLGKAVNDGKDYFLGTVVTIPSANGSLEVVDGQQRLATTAILLAAIRDYLSDKNEDVLVESINNEFLTGIDRVKRARVARLRLNVDDNDLFSHLIRREPSDPLGEATRPSHELLINAYGEAQKYVHNIVAIVDPKDHGDVLNRWVEFIEHAALVVLLRVADDADAYKMFETLNGRGLQTSQADLIKNHLFGRSGSRFNEVQSRWSYMRGALETLDSRDITIDFLRHALIVMNGYLVAADVYDTVQNQAKSEQAAVSLTGHLETLANAYVATFNPEHERWNGYPETARSSIEVLNLLDVKPMRALLLAVASRMDPKQAAQSFQFLVSLSVRLMIASSTRSGSVEQPLAGAAQGVFDGSIESADSLKEELTGLTPGDEEFKTAFETARVTNGRLARYFLRSLEMTAKGEAEPWFVPHNDQTVINLEHVLPKKPQDNWPDVTEDEVRLFVNRIGNLVLLRASDNSNIKSDAFVDKKPVLEESPYVLTYQVGELGEWTPATIADRQKQLASLALVTWPIG